jgi:hypothetical protein
MINRKSSIRGLCLAAVVLAGSGMARQLVVLAAGGADCVQVGYDVRLVPYAIDPAAVRGSLLPPVPGEPSIWMLRPGKWNRPRAICCDPNGYDVDVVYAGGTLSNVTVDVNNVDHTWSCAAELVPGDQVLYFEATNRPRFGLPAKRVVTILFRVPEPTNLQPVLY